MSNICNTGIPFRAMLAKAGTRLAALLCIVCVVSCAQTDVLPENDSSWAAETNIKASLTITVSGGSMSRAVGTLGPGYDTGEGYENYIDIEGGDFRFYFFDSENKYVASFPVEVLIPLESNQSSKRYSAGGTVKRSLIERNDLKLVILANWKSYKDESDLIEGETTIDDLCSQQYAFTTDMMELSDENTIPLYGVSDILAPQPVNDRTYDLGKLHLLRAFAKIEIVRYDGGFEIESVALTRYSSKGYCAPSEIYLQSEYVHNDYDKDYANIPHIPGGAYTDRELPFRKIDEDHYIAYVPEFDNLTDIERRAQIKIQFRATSEPDYLEFKYYSGDKVNERFDILRNYWYRYSVRKKGVIVQVIPYSEVALNPIFGLESNLELVKIEVGNDIYYYDRETGIFYDENLRLIDNPYFPDTDPLTGWSILRDDNNSLISYYDAKTGKSYAIDKETEILDPNNNRDSENPTLMKVALSDTGYVLYYHNKTTSTLYASNKETEILNPFDYYDKNDGMMRFISADRTKTFGYYNLNDRKWYAPDRTTVIANPFSN